MNTGSSIEQGSLTDDDLQAHVEDDMMVQRIVNGQAVSYRWNDLTEEERRARYEALFDPHGFNLTIW